MKMAARSTRDDFGREEKDRETQQAKDGDHVLGKDDGLHGWCLFGWGLGGYSVLLGGMQVAKNQRPQNHSLE